MRALLASWLIHPIGVISLCLALLLVGACAKRPVYRPPPHGTLQLIGPASELEPLDGVADAARGRGGSSIVVLTLEDARSEEHRDGMSSWIEEHDGFTGEATTGDRAYGRPVAEMASDALADALMATGRFENVLRASSTGEKEADLFLSGRIRRLRGWQAYRVDEDQPTRILQSMGDVFIDEIRIDDERNRPVYLGQTGAMLKEVPEEVDPYLIAQQALDEALIELARHIADSQLHEDLEPLVLLPTNLEGDVDDLLSELPRHWAGARREATKPPGWMAENACPLIRLKDDSRRFFHPRMGFYTPVIDLWFCEKDWRGEIGLFGDGDDRFPARVIGFTVRGEAVLGLSLGKTSWPSAFDDLVGYLGLAPPPSQPLMKLPIESTTKSDLGPPASLIRRERDGL